MGRYAAKTEAELAYILRDAGEAAECARENGDSKAEGKYRDQVCDAATERYQRQQRAIKPAARSPTTRVYQAQPAGVETAEA